MSNDQTYFKYLTVSENDKDWGVSLSAAGYARIAPKTVYPPKGHPAGYHFDWQHGRIIHEYQIIYITAGGGKFESEATGILHVNKGTVIFLFPEVWHRYEPDKRTGWDEHWISLNGYIPDRLKQKGISCGCGAGKCTSEEELF